MDLLACSDFAVFADTPNFVALIAITFGCGVGVVAIIGGTIGGIMRTRAKEATKRELAAYVAEGTLDPDKAIAMINAGMKKWQTPDPGRHS